MLFLFSTGDSCRVIKTGEETIRRQRRSGMEGEAGRVARRQRRTFLGSFAEETACKQPQKCVTFVTEASRLDFHCYCYVLGNFLEVYPRSSDCGLGQLSDVGDSDCEKLSVFQRSHSKDPRCVYGSFPW